MGQSDQRLLTATENVCKDGYIGTNNLIFCSGYNTHNLFPNLQKRSVGAGVVALSKHFHHYGQRLCFSYYNTP